MDFSKTLVSLLLFLVLIASTVFGFDDLNKNINYENHANEIIQNFADEVHKEWGFCSYGHGGCLAFDVDSLSIKFSVNKQATIDEARGIVVRLTRRFVEKINNHENIRPFLREYPFTSSRARISLSFTKSSDGSYFEEGVNFVFNGKNHFFYEKEDSHTGKFIELLQEPCEEAFRIVNEGRNSR